jgi:uncharacterized protein YciI
MNAGRIEKTTTVERNLMRRSIGSALIGFLFCFAIAAAAHAQESQPAQKNSQTPQAYQLVMFKVGPAWVKDKALYMQPGIQEHAAYMSKLVKEGVLILGGPLYEDAGLSTINGGVMVLAAETPAAARQILEIDPARRAGLFEITDIRPFRITGGSCNPARTQ